jgi:hypothetical protein
MELADIKHNDTLKEEADWTNQSLLSSSDTIHFICWFSCLPDPKCQSSRHPGAEISKEIAPQR